jgi:hypothetical protein
LYLPAFSHTANRHNNCKARSSAIGENRSTSIQADLAAVGVAAKIEDVPKDFTAIWQDIRTAKGKMPETIRNLYNMPY